MLNTISKAFAIVLGRVGNHGKEKCGLPKKDINAS